MNNLETLKINELETIGGGGGPWSNFTNAAVGTIAVGNAIAIGAATAPIWGAAAAIGGAYCIYNALD